MNVAMENLSGGLQLLRKDASYQDSVSTIKDESSGAAQVATLRAIACVFFWRIRRQTIRLGLPYAPTFSVSPTRYAA